MELKDNRDLIDPNNLFGLQEDEWDYFRPLWGHFNEPIKTVEDMNSVMTKEQIEKHKTDSQQLPKFDYMKSKDIHPEFFGKFDRQTRRSITPPGFAKAFFEANRWILKKNLT